MKGSKDYADPRPLIEAAQQDPARFGEVYELYFDRVYAFVYGRVRDRDAAEDVTSEVFQSAFRNIGRFEWRGVPFSAWLFRIAANELADHFRRLSRTRNNADLEALDPPQPLHSFQWREDDVIRGHIYELIRVLPADQRCVVEMRFAEEKSIREIALFLGRSEGAVKQLQFRALKCLRAQLRGPSRMKSGGRNG